jgi:Mannosyl-glycoprotein endo-beta-N-acetylglucosaminidase
MGRIFLGISHAERGKIFDSETGANIEQIILLRDRVVSELRSRGCEVFAVPDELSLSYCIEWINNRALSGDIALAIESHRWQETSIFYIANNIKSKKHAELILSLLIRSLPEMTIQGSKPDTVSPMGSLAFCRQVHIPSLLIKIGSLNRIDAITVGLTDGLMAWCKEVSFVKPISYIDIELNKKIYAERGILIDHNAYIPIDLCDRLGIDIDRFHNVHLVRHSGVVYLPAIALRDNNISVDWDNLSQTVILRSNLLINRSQIDDIIGRGNTSEVQMIIFLRTTREDALKSFPDLPRIYREESAIEGINYDIAFCQMCLETDFLRLQPIRNNFANLGSLEEGVLASFSDVRLGVRAHIQHLKAYASLEPLAQEIIDPRFHFVRRGIATKVSQLSGRWSDDLAYGDKIMAILRRLYESVNLL